tara:strand:+ start:15196 stop:16422 length:1227 start_codon:yes stop_codon:yes gene_type:complete
MDVSDRLDVSTAHSTLNKEERDACSNVLNTSQHVTLKVLPNHHIDADGELRGYMFLSHLDDSADVLPVNKKMFDMISMYECGTGDDTDHIFHPDALRIINNVSEYKKILGEYILELKETAIAPANFDCIHDDNDSSRFSQNHPDQRVWSESLPSRVGLYHAFSRSNTKDRREHKLFIVISGCLNHACEALQNFWHDCRSQYKCKDVLQSEEIQWLRSATHRNHNRIASAIAERCKLTVKRVIDTDDPTGRQRMVLPTTFSYKTDCSVNVRQQKARIVDGGCFLDTDSNGVLFEMFPSEGYWLFQGPRDLSDMNNMFGTQFNSNKQYPCFPTNTVRFHQRFPVRDARTSVRVNSSAIMHNVILDGKPVSHSEYSFPDEAYFKHLELLGFERNNGCVNIMPIVVYTHMDM